MVQMKSTSTRDPVHLASCVPQLLRLTCWHRSVHRQKQLNHYAFYYMKLRNQILYLLCYLWVSEWLAATSCEQTALEKRWWISVHTSKINHQIVKAKMRKYSGLKTKINSICGRLNGMPHRLLLSCVSEYMSQNTFLLNRCHSCCRHSLRWTRNIP